MFAVHYKNTMYWLILCLLSGKKIRVSLLYQIKNSTDVPTSSVACFTYYMCVGLMGYDQKTGSKDSKGRCGGQHHARWDIWLRTGVDQTPQPQVRVLLHLKIHIFKRCILYNTVLILYIYLLYRLKINHVKKGAINVRLFLSLLAWLQTPVMSNQSFTPKIHLRAIRNGKSLIFVQGTDHWVERLYSKQFTKHDIYTANSSLRGMFFQPIIPFPTFILRQS